VVGWMGAVWLLGNAGLRSRDATYFGSENIVQG